MPEHEEYQTVPRARMAPPVDTGADFLRQQKSNWPSTIGVICIVFGALAALGAAMGVVGNLLHEQIASITASARQQSFSPPEGWLVWTMSEQVGRLVLAIILIVGGVKLTRRRPSSARMCRRWAWLKIALVIYATGLAWKMLPIQMEEFSKNPEFQKMGVSMQMMEMFARGMIIFALAWGCALPIFLLIWFARRRIKDEVQGWSEAVLGQ